MIPDEVLDRRIREVLPKALHKDPFNTEFVRHQLRVGKVWVACDGEVLGEIWARCFVEVTFERAFRMVCNDAAGIIFEGEKEE